MHEIHILDKINLNELKINKNYTNMTRVFCAYESFEGITDLICETFDIYGGELSLQSFDFVFKHILKHCDHMKSSHHQILINILSFIPLKMLI
jgi:hypothetical protein